MKRKECINVTENTVFRMANYADDKAKKLKSGLFNEAAARLEVANARKMCRARAVDRSARQVRSQAKKRDGRSDLAMQDAEFLL